MDQRINLREERDFGEKFNATFLFVRQNFKSLALTMLLLGSPIMILGTVLMAYFQTMLMPQNGFMTFSDLPEGFFGYLGLTVVVNMLAYAWLNTITLTYVNEYLKGNTDITPTTVFTASLSKFVTVVASYFLVGIIIMIGFVFLIIPGIYLSVALTLVTAILIFENKSISESIGRSIKLISGKWWSTFGLMFVMGFVVGLMQIVFTIPVYIDTFVKTMHGNMGNFGVTTIVAHAIGSLGTTLLYPLVFVALVFQYFNLVERKEGAGLMQQIDHAGIQVENTSKNEGDF